MPPVPPASKLSGSAGRDFYKTTFGYDTNGHQNKIVNAVGTITRTVYDGFGRTSSVWMGTSDASWTPTNAASMTKLADTSTITYDPAIVVNADSNLTRVINYPTGTNSVRIEETYYDWRDRPIAVKSGIGVDANGRENLSGESTSTQGSVIYQQYDNLNEVVASYQYDGDQLGVRDYTTLNYGVWQ